MTTFPHESLQLGNGTITAWLPLSTPFPSVAACSNQVYAVRNLGTLIAFDPIYPESIDLGATACLPAEVTSSWRQSGSGVTTILGPTFTCPGAYSPVTTITVDPLTDPLTELVLCCPSQYKLNTPITELATFPSQCTSTLTSGQVFIFQSPYPNAPWGQVTSTVPATTAAGAGPTIVYAVHVNGYNILNSSTSSTTSSSTPTISTQPSQTSSPPRNRDSPTRLSSGAAVGIGIGVTILGIAALIGGWSLFRRVKRKRQLKELAWPPTTHAAELDIFVNQGNSAHEMYAPAAEMT